jgi:hypothetical protein
MKRGTKDSHEETSMPHATRITPQEARKKVAAGQAMLVCGYEDSEKCRRYDLDGSLNFQELWRRQPGKQQEIIFYCA